MTIGIIEDDTLLHQALKTALQNAGYQTVSVYTKREALTTITGSESLLLIDIGLPDGNGLACYKKIREKAEIPAIFLTARDEETDMVTAFDTGADDYVGKTIFHESASKAHRGSDRTEQQRKTTGMRRNNIIS